MGKPWERSERPEPSRSPHKPAIRFTLDAHGRKVRLYECPFCRDRGVASLPRYRREETDADLVRSSGTLCFAYPCPVCKSTEISLRGEPLSDAHKARLQRWRRARRAELDRYAAEDAGEVLSFAKVLAKARGAVRRVPALSEIDQNEIAAKMRKEKAGG